VPAPSGSRYRSWTSRGFISRCTKQPGRGEPQQGKIVSSPSVDQEYGCLFPDGDTMAFLRAMTALWALMAAVCSQPSAAQENPLE
jgi:hypothetical protein